MKLSNNGNIVQTASCILFWSDVKADEPQQLLNE